MNKINYDFRNRTAIVTGGAQGFGLDIAQRFLKSGAKVIIWDIDPKLIEEAKRETNNSNLSSSIVDVSNYQEVESEVSKITQKSKIDILINNAGITGIMIPRPVISMKIVININKRLELFFFIFEDVNLIFNFLK